MRRFIGIVAILTALIALSPVERAASQTAPAARCENVILVTTDGLRWQELFEGAEEALIDKQSGGIDDVRLVRERYWASSAEQRRRRLLPFCWEVVARDGQLIGNPDRGSTVRCTNGRFFSYPGYNELLCGFADPAIDSNDKQPNANVNVLEWLARQSPQFEAPAAFASWDVFPYILNVRRNRMYVNAGWQPLEAFAPEQQATIAQLNRAADELPRYWQGVRYDLFTFRGAMAYLEAKTPRVFYLSLGETDDWCHAGRYDLYLEAAHRFDAYLRELWGFLQSHPQYRDKTAVVISTDHGRGSGSEGWKNHSAELPGSDMLWIAGLGPGIPPLGDRAGVTASQAQVAASVAALAGRDFTQVDPRIAAPIDWQATPAP